MEEKDITKGYGFFKEKEKKDEVKTDDIKIDEIKTDKPKRSDIPLFIGIFTLIILVGLVVVVTQQSDRISTLETKLNQTNMILNQDSIIISNLNNVTGQHEAFNHDVNIWAGNVNHAIELLNNRTLGIK